MTFRFLIFISFIFIQKYAIKSAKSRDSGKTYSQIPLGFRKHSSITLKSNPNQTYVSLTDQSDIQLRIKQFQLDSP